MSKTHSERIDEIAGKVDYANFLFPIITAKAHRVNSTLLFDTPVFLAYLF